MNRETKRALAALHSAAHHLADAVDRLMESADSRHASEAEALAREAACRATEFARLMRGGKPTQTY